MNVYEEIARTKWKPSGVLRLRVCIHCRSTFPSAGSDERRCSKCAKKLEDARARAFTPNPESEVKDMLDDWFDEELVDRRRRDNKHDSERRIRRRNGKRLRS